MNAQATKLQAAENDLKQLMADVTRAIEKAQHAVDSQRFKTINPRIEGGQPGRCPFLIGKREWTIKRATLLCLRACRSSAQASPGSRVILFWVGSLLRSVQPPLSA
jgi:hypothetical protein